MPGMTNVIDDEVAGLVESGCVLTLGTVDADGSPEAARAWSAEVLPDRAHLRVVVGAGTAFTVGHLEARRRVALTATDVRTLRSVQVKGRVLAVEPETPADAARREQVVAEVSAAIVEVDGVPPGLVRRLLPSEHVVFEMTAEEVYDQTPGPSAGCRVDRAGA